MRDSRPGWRTSRLPRGTRNGMFREDVAVDLDGTLNLDAAPHDAYDSRQGRHAGRDQRDVRRHQLRQGRRGAGMVENYLGKEVFRQGVHNYLAAHLYGNATAEDFWNAQTENSHKPVDKIMESFVAQPGVPGLTFARAAERQGRGGSAAIFPESERQGRWAAAFGQSRFALRPASGKSDCEVLSSAQASLPIPERRFFLCERWRKGLLPQHVSGGRLRQAGRQC
jgi:hypothetical protein